jgi:ribosome-associated protein
LVINSRVSVPLSEVRLGALRAGGPGGQNVNKVSNGVELRWDLAASCALTAEQKQRARERLGRRVNGAGELVLRAVEFRERPRNVAAVLERMRTLVARAIHQDAARRPTRPTRGAQRRRREAKAHRSAVKRQRGSAGDD